MIYYKYSIDIKTNEFYIVIQINIKTIINLKKLTLNVFKKISRSVYIRVKKPSALEWNYTSRIRFNLGKFVRYKVLHEIAKRFFKLNRSFDADKILFATKGTPNLRGRFSAGLCTCLIKAEGQIGPISEIKMYIDIEWDVIFHSCPFSSIWQKKGLTF